jgi:GTPase
MRFIDEVTLEIAAGNGGNGAVAFRRERRNPRGGPSGGDGGRGGDVVFRGSRNLGTLLDLRSRPRIRAKRGKDGGGNDCNGRGAPAVVIDVPLGTLVIDVETDGTIGDITQHDQEVVAACGGRGGLGNIHFATASNRAPRHAEPGEAGESRTVRLELKLLADVGLVGLPNAGKSTLIAAISAARPKIADYPFTTLVPNLGVVSLSPDAAFVVADIPGIIRGAAEGAGLGTRFLKHIQRTALLLFVLAPDDTGETDLLVDLSDLKQEVAAFDDSLASRPHMVVLNKTDLPAALEAEKPLRSHCESQGIPFAVISAVTHQGLDPLKQSLMQMVAECRASRQESGRQETPSDMGMSDGSSSPNTPADSLFPKKNAP